MTPVCSIIIPVFNQLRYTRECIAAIQTYTKGVEFEIIVVDNGSSDETPEFLRFLKSQDARVKVVSSSTNLGYAEGNNLGADLATGKYLVFLNNDTVPLEGWLPNLLKIAASPENGAVGPKLLYAESGRINHIGYVYNGTLQGFYPLYHKCRDDLPAANNTRAFQALLGACLLVKREVFFEVGKFSNFGLEDVDLCLKIGATGKKIITCTEAVVYHYGSVTLQLSPEGSIPSTDLVEFNRRWDPAKLIWDDIDYYRTDGFSFCAKAHQDRSIRSLEDPKKLLALWAEQVRAQGDHATYQTILKELSDVYSFTPT